MYYRRRYVQNAIDELQQGQEHRCSWDCQHRYAIEARLFRADYTIKGLAPDDSGRNFIERSKQVGSVRVIAAIAMRIFLSVTDTNALCGTGDMHIFSTAQAKLLLNMTDDHEPSGNLLDVGAGDGGITAQLAPLFSTVTTTEVSERMATRLEQRGFKCVVTMDPSTVPEATCIDLFECVSCLNVLDRCNCPLDLLASLRDLLVPDTGRLLLAVVLPFNPGIEQGTEWCRPKQNVPENVYHKSFEIAANALAFEVLEPLGFRIESISRLPCISDLPFTI